MCKSCLTWRPQFRTEPFDDSELAKLRKARGLPAHKLTAMFPAWLKRHLADSRMPEPFRFDPPKNPVFPGWAKPCKTVEPPVYETYTAQGGPFDGLTIELSNASRETALFSFRDQKGRYVRTKKPGHWTSGAVNWQPS